MKKYITVAGNIGVGKSTLVEMIYQRIDFQPFFEPVTENPYLADFYANMNAWSFHSQIFFLTHRIRIHQQLILSPTSVIQDRSIYEDAENFAKNLFLNQQLSERDYKTYCSVYESFKQVIHAPDLIIYLRASVPTLQQRIAQRARAYEREIEDTYLAQLNTLYSQWVGGIDFCPVLTIPADDLDFVAHSFVRNKSDLMEVNNILKEYNSHLKIISKITQLL